MRGLDLPVFGSILMQAVMLLGCVEKQQPLPGSKGDDSCQGAEMLAAEAKCSYDKKVIQLSVTCLNVEGRLNKDRAPLGMLCGCVQSLHT